MSIHLSVLQQEMYMYLEKHVKDDEKNLADNEIQFVVTI